MSPHHCRTLEFFPMPSCREMPVVLASNVLTASQMFSLWSQPHCCREMTGFVCNTPLGEGLAGEMGWTVGGDCHTVLAPLFMW